MRATTQPTKETAAHSDAYLLRKYGPGQYVAGPRVPVAPERTPDVLQARHDAFHTSVGRYVTGCTWCGLEEPLASGGVSGPPSSVRPRKVAKNAD